MEAGVVSSGTAESLLSVSSVTKTGQMHQITASSLLNLLKAAYNEYCHEQADNLVNVLSFEGWCARRKIQSPQFHFWHVVLSVELTVFFTHQVRS